LQQAIPVGENILAAVREQAPPAYIPSGSRTKTPKTPSPKKMDQILQRDMLNKRRFLQQQQQQVQSDSVEQIASNIRRSGFTNESATLHNGDGKQAIRSQSVGVQQSSFGKLIPSVPFPTIASRTVGTLASKIGLGHVSKRGSESSGVAQALNHGSGVANGPNISNSAAAVHASKASVAMIHSGSNVINSEHTGI
jgi:hypothetical protein